MTVNSIGAFGFRLTDVPLNIPSLDLVPRSTLNCVWAEGMVDGPETGWVGQPVGSRVELGWGGYASYAINFRHDGGEVRITTDGVGQTQAAIALLLTVLPLTLPMVELEPLHGPALLLPSGEALLVLGRSGAGKSTIAGLLHQRGLVGLSDDVSAVDRDGRLWPGPPLHAPYEGDGSELGTYDGKVVLPLPLPPVTNFEIAGILILDPLPTDSIASRKLFGVQAFRSILAHARGPTFLTDRRRSTQFRVVSRVAGGRVLSTSFDHRRHPPQQVVGAIAEWLESLSRRPSVSSPE